MLTLEDEIATLKEALKDEETQLVKLGQLVEKDLRERDELEKNIALTLQKSHRYTESMKDTTHEELMAKLNELRDLKEMIAAKQEQLADANKRLEVFGDLQPTQGALRLRIDELRRSRLSLDLSFMENQ